MIVPEGIGVSLDS